MMPNRATVAVIGAGMSGLFAARELYRRDVDVVVLEAANRVGGRVLGEISSLGSLLDLGGQWIGHGHHRFEALAAELGATQYPMHTPKRPAIVDDGRVLSAASPAILTAYAALLVTEVASHLPKPGRWNTTTVASVLRRIPSQRARRILEELAVVSTTADLDRLSIQALASMIRYEGGLPAMLGTKGGAQDSLLVEGAGSLADRMATELDGRVYASCRVSSIRDSDDGVTVETTSGAVRASRVIVTVPPPVVGVITFDPPLPPKRIALQANTYMGSVYKAVAVYERPFWRGRHDAEMIMLSSPGCAVFDTTPPDGPGHLCFLVAGPEARQIDDLDPSTRRSALLGPLAFLLGAQVAEPASFHEKSWHQDEFVRGGYLALPVLGTRDGYLPVASEPVGRIHWAGTETAAEHAGYIEGAIESGGRAAREVIAAL